MTRRREPDIAALARCAETDLQTIQDALGDSTDVQGRVRFPRGFLETSYSIRFRLPHLGDETLRRNISYALMMHDVLRWLTIRTDIGGTALAMVVKEAICLLGSICESWTKFATHGHASSRGFHARTQKLVELSIIDDPLRIELDWIWSIRSREHLFEVTEWETSRYGRSDHRRAVKAFEAFRERLKTHFR